MKYFLTITLLCISWNVFGSDFDCEVLEWRKKNKTKKAVLLKIFALAHEQDSRHIKEYVANHLFGDQWKHFTYPVEKDSLLNADQAIARNIIIAQLENKSLEEGRFDVYKFMIKHTDRLRFNSNESSKMDTQ